MDPLDLVSSTADAAFATDQDGRIVIWNKAAEQLLGHKAERVLGKPCHDILCGLDIFSNRFCDENCAVRNMVHRHEGVHRFELSIQTASGQAIRASFSVITVQGRKSGQHTVIHTFQPVDQRREVEDLLRHLRTGRAPAAPASLPSAPAPSPVAAALTARETEILQLLADGSNNQGIADRLFISVATVRNHIQNILRKLEVHSKTEAVALAYRQGLI